MLLISLNWLIITLPKLTGTIGGEEMKKRGVFVLPGFAKFVVKNKAATKARKGINPFTKEYGYLITSLFVHKLLMFWNLTFIHFLFLNIFVKRECIFKAKPARKMVKARAVKTLRTCV